MKQAVESVYISADFGPVECVARMFPHVPGHDAVHPSNGGFSVHV